MDALILAAGRGTRMGGIEKPKCLLDFDGTALIDYQINCFKKLGINRIFVITGFHSNLIHSHVNEKVIYLHNENFFNSNNISSIWTARNSITDDFICVYGDLLFNQKILQHLLQDEHDICLVIEKNVRHETMKVKIENCNIVQVNKKIPESEADGNFIGMAKFNHQIIPKFFQAISTIMETDVNTYYTSAIELLIKNGQQVNFIATNNLQWMDIDEPNEFDDAKVMFKQIEGES